MKRFAFLLVLLSFVCLVSELNATVTTRHYDFEEGAAGGEATELIDITDALLHENDQDLYQWVTGQVQPPSQYADLVSDIAQTFQK